MLLRCLISGSDFLVQLTAVPFVGKDVPSTRSEFAHPDVVIGCTILAYRLLPMPGPFHFQATHARRSRFPVSFLD